VFSPALYGFKSLRSASPATTRWAGFPGNHKNATWIQWM
jgi:hypothetical protein